jgi:transcription antitermination factor NusB
MSTSTPRRRTRAREAALQFLYQVDLCGETVLEQLDEFLTEDDRHADVRDFAKDLILGAVRSRGRTDRLLGVVARNWDLHRMATIDRNILRLAIHELLDRPDIPPKVTINEAIELAKKFSTANSGAFVNGILDRVRIDYVDGNRQPPPIDADEAEDSERTSPPTTADPPPLPSGDSIAEVVDDETASDGREPADDLDAR